jgi:hypothetical protein
MEPKRSLRVPRKTWFAVACLALVVVLLIQSNSTVLVDSYPRMDSYRVVSERAIVLTVAVAPRSWTRVANVTETSTDVRVKVESLDWPIPLPGTSELELRDLTISLADVLGVRAVRDAAGQVISSR